MNRVRKILQLALALVLLGGLTTVVAADDSIYACVNKTSGAVRIIKPPAPCARNEVLISWNVTGPQGLKGDDGAPGEPGAPGDQGIQGVAGPSGQGPAYIAARMAQSWEEGQLTSTLPGDQLVTLDLPAGAYVVMATAWVGPATDGGNFDLFCELAAESDVDLAPANAAPAAMYLPLTVLHTFAAPGSVTLTCYDSLALPAMWMLAKITAIQVQSTNIQ